MSNPPKKPSYGHLLPDLTNRVGIIALLCLLFFSGYGQALAFDQEKEAKNFFKKCVACHQIGPQAVNKVGPQLNALNGRLIGSIEDYKYSKIFKQLSTQNIVWNEETLDAFLKKPRAFAKGTKMSFSGMRKEENRSVLIEWLLNFDASGEFVALSQKPDVEISSAVVSANLLGSSAAKLSGDPEYGQFLSGECVTCHKPSGGDDGIPSIVGWPKENFIHALYEYKGKFRNNPVMQNVASRLGDEEMAALAAYFGSINSD